MERGLRQGENREQEVWDRLTLLLIADPRPGWGDVYSEITRREIERLMPAHKDEGA